MDEIKDTIEKHRETLREKYGMEIVAAFGSYIRGEATQRSDLDLLAEIKEPISLFELVGAEIYLTEILGTKVDLVPKQDLREELKDRILSEAVPL